CALRRVCHFMAMTTRPQPARSKPAGCLAATSAAAPTAASPALNHARAVQVADRLSAIPGVNVVNDSFFNEFTVTLPKPARAVVHDLAAKGVLGGVSLGRLYPDEAALENGLIVAVTEVVSDEDIAAFEAALKEVLA
ncbi:MAG: hypothetical protein ACK56H_08035, partial [Novosphingobium sp.]